MFHWDKVVAASAAMEAELSAVFAKYGFSRNQSIEEHPHEAFSYWRVYTSVTATEEDVRAIKERLINVSPFFGNTGQFDGAYSLELQRPTYYNPDGVVACADGVAVFADGPAHYETGGKPFVAIEVFYTLMYPEYTFESFSAERELEMLWGENYYWKVFPVDKQPIEELATRVREELVPRSYVEGTNGPWITFTRGKVMVAICNSPEYAIIGAEGSQRVVPKVDKDAANARHEWPVVIVHVTGWPR